jgi:hypothetical protein
LGSAMGADVFSFFLPQNKRNKNNIDQLSRNCLLADMSAEAMRKLSVTVISYLSVDDY